MEVVGGGIGVVELLLLCGGMLVFGAIAVAIATLASRRDR